MILDYLIFEFFFEFAAFKNSKEEIDSKFILKLEIYNTIKSLNLLTTCKFYVN